MHLGLERIARIQHCSDERVFAAITATQGIDELMQLVNSGSTGNACEGLVHGFGTIRYQRNRARRNVSRRKGVMSCSGSQYHRGLLQSEKDPSGGDALLIESLENLAMFRKQPFHEETGQFQLAIAHGCFDVAAQVRQHHGADIGAA